MKPLFTALVFLLLISCKQQPTDSSQNINEQEDAKTFEQKLSNAALSIIDPTIDYDPAYFSIEYPNGDVPKKKAFVQMSLFARIEN